MFFCLPKDDYSALALKLVEDYYESAVTTEQRWNAADVNNHLFHCIRLHKDITNERTLFLARISEWMHHG